MLDSPSSWFMPLESCFICTVLLLQFFY